MPSKLATTGSGATTRRAEAEEPGKPQNENPSLSPSNSASRASSAFFGGNDPETAPFTGEPDRENLTQPPAGYQTPSSNFAYGTGPKEALGNKHTDVISGKEVTY